jgi:hypothetical protein
MEWLTLIGWCGDEVFMESFRKSELEQMINMDLNPIVESDACMQPRSMEDCEAIGRLDEYTEKVCAACSEYLSGRTPSQPDIRVRFITSGI